MSWAHRDAVGIEDGRPEEAAGPGHGAVRVVALGRGVEIGDADDPVVWLSERERE
jgi:hypothetical protein